MHLITNDELMAINDKDPDEVTSHEISLMIFTIAEILDRQSRAMYHITNARMMLNGRAHVAKDKANELPD